MDKCVPQFDSFLRPGFEPGDVPRLQTLLGARNLLDTFIGIFRGSTEEVIVRILVLATLASRGEAPRWTPTELDAALCFIEPISLETARTRLSKYGLIVYDTADGTYAVGDQAFIVLAAWASAMQFADARFGEFGFMNAQIVGGAETLGVPEDLLRFALARTNTIHHELERAIVTGSVTAIQEARAKINDVFTWGEQGVEILEKIAPDHEIGAERRVAARQLADAQSRMLGLAPRLDRTLHALDAQRVRLGDSGLDSTDLKTWLRLCSADTLNKLIELVGIPIPGPVLVLGEVALDVAEELLNSDRPQDVALPEAVEPLEIPPPEITFDKARLEKLFSILDNVDKPLPLALIVECKTFDEASYYLSLLPLLGGQGEISNYDPAARLATYSLEVYIEQGLTDVSTGEVASVSSGEVRPRNS